MTMSPVQPSPVIPPLPASRSLAGRVARWPLRLASALTSPADLDRYLELFGPMRVQREIRAEVIGIQHQTPGTVTLTLRPNRAWTGHRAGQHVLLGVEINGAFRTRSYSPAGSEHGRDRLVELTVKQHPEGLVSPELVTGLRPGTVVRLSAAEGEFVLPTPRPRRLLLISGGSGITPVISMLRTLADEGHDGEVLFLHYAQTAADVTYRDELARLQQTLPGARVVLAYTRQDPGPDGGPRGHFQPGHLGAAADWFAQAPAFVCGPASLITDVTRCYEEKSAQHLVHVERFTIDGTQLPGAITGPPTGQITFSTSRITAANTGRSLLQQAEAAGLAPEYGCRMGSCHGCVQVKRSGVVLNQLTGALNADPDTQIQTCISVPVGDVDLRI